MADTGLGSTYALTAEQIDAHVGHAIGVYVLGRLDTSEDRFYRSYVGRSDDNLNARLHRWVGGRYRHFKFGHRSTKRAAFEKECTMYHDFGGKEKLDNQIHPGRPEGTDYHCPVSGCTELDWISWQR